MAVASLPTSTTSDEAKVVPGMHKRKRSDDSDEAYGSESPKRTKFTETPSPPANEEIVVLPTPSTLPPSPPPPEISSAPVVASLANPLQIKPSTSGLLQLH